MTKREICERLMEIRDQSYKGHLGPVGIVDALRDLLLDIAAPEEEKEQKREEKHPGVIVDPSGKNPPRCLRCGLDAEVVQYYKDMGAEWACCLKCGCAYRIKRGKDEK